MSTPTPAGSGPPLPPRLQRILASAGFGSRRQCEELILAGRVEIDRQAVTELGTRVDSEQQEIRVDGVVLHVPRRKYFMLHKPVDVVSTTRDPWARTRVLDLVDDPDRLFTVGRLDKSSSGLILVTNDGELANQLAHPRYRVEKTYRVTVAGKLSPQVIRQLKQGIHLAEGKTHVERLEVKQTRLRQSVLEIVLTEGRNREIRRILARVGHKVRQLKRVAIGPLRLGELPIGAYRELTGAEVRKLRQMAHSGQSASPRRPKRSTDQPRGKRLHPSGGGVAPRPSGPAQRKKSTSVRGRTGSKQDSSKRPGRPPRKGHGHVGKRSGGKKKP